MDIYNLDGYALIVHEKPWHPEVKMNDNEIQIECKTGMTSITLAINSSPSNTEELTKICSNMENKFLMIKSKKEKEFQYCWDKLGYCGVEFIDWLIMANGFVNTNTQDKNDPKQLYMQKAYVKGIDTVYDALFN